MSFPSYSPLQHDYSSFLAKIWEKGCQFLGSSYAIMGGAMTWVSNYQLVGAISGAGGFGVLACGAMSPQLLDEEIVRTKALLNSRPFGVNLILMHPQLAQLIDVCCDHQLSHVVLAGGLPTTQIIKRLSSHHIKVIGFAPSSILAKRLVRSGINALIIEGHEAGGHIGPVSTSVLAQEILFTIQDIPIFIAGGIGRGEAIASYLQMGAAGVQLGTRFVCAFESPAHPNFKQAFIRASAREAAVSIQLDPRFPVIPVRSLANQSSQNFIVFQGQIIKDYENGVLTLEEAKLKIEHFWSGALRKAVIDGDIINGSLMAGQSVGMITKEESTQDIINELVMQATNFLGNQSENKLGNRV